MISEPDAARILERVIANKQSSLLLEAMMNRHSFTMDPETFRIIPLSPDVLERSLQFASNRLEERKKK